MTSLLKADQLRLLLAARKEAIAHKSWILGLPIDLVRWHIPAIAGNTVFMHEVEVTRGLGLKREDRERLRREEGDLNVTPIYSGYVRTPNQRRGFRAWRIDPSDPFQMMGLSTPTDPSHLEFIDGDELPDIFENSDHYTRPGWLLPKLMCDDLNLNMKWYWWQKQYLRGEFDNEQLPRISFYEEYHPRPRQIMHYWLDLISPTWRTDESQRRRVVSYLLRWLLWSLGHHSMPQQPLDEWDGRAHDRLIQTTQEFKVLMLWARAHFTDLLEELGLIDKRVPLKTALRLAKDIFPGRRNDYRATLTVIPEADANLILAASNYTTNLLVLSTDTLASQAALLDCYMFAPTAVFPFQWMVSDSITDGELLDCLGRFGAIAKAQKLPRNYFSATEVASDGVAYRPIHQLKWKAQQSINEDNSELAIVALEDSEFVQLLAGMPVVQFASALPVPPERKLLLPEITPALSGASELPGLPQGRSIIELPEIKEGSSSNWLLPGS